MVDTAARLRASAPPLPVNRAARRAETAPVIRVVRADRAVLAEYERFCETAVYGTAQAPEWVNAFTAQPSSDCLLIMMEQAGTLSLALPLEVVTTRGIRIARFIGGSHANGSFPAVSFGQSAQAMDRTGLSAILASLRQARPDIDALILERQAPQRQRVENPFRGLATSESPNLAFEATLNMDFDVVIDRGNGKRKRKRNRSHLRTYEQAGGFRRIVAAGQAEVDRLFAAFLEMRAARFARIGVADSFADGTLRAALRDVFVRSLASSSKRFTLEGLEVGGVLRSVTGSSHLRDRVVCEFTAFADDDLAASGPGDFLFFENIRAACADGYQVYDFSVGDERYKRAWCDIEVTQFDTLAPLTIKGRAFVVAQRAVATVKREIKRRPALWALVKRLRRSTGADTRGQTEPD